MSGLSGTLPAPVNQLAEATSDGQPDENARDNCAGADLAWCIRALTGKQTNGDALKDSAYGQGYTGLTAIGRYAEAVARFGVRIVGHEGLSPNGVTGAVLTALEAGHPVIVGIPSDWDRDPPTSPFVHFVVLCCIEPTGNWRAMNPWGGFWQWHSRDWWQSRFRLGACWVIERAEAAMAWTIEKDSAGHITGARDANGATLGRGMAAELVQHAGWLESDALVGDRYYSATRAIAALRNDAWMHYDKATNQTTPHNDGGQVVAELFGLTVAAAAKISALQSQLAACQAASGHGSDAADAAIAALAAALAALTKQTSAAALTVANSQAAS